jgi:hypothetical protein
MGLNTKNKVSNTNWAGGWVSPRGGMDAVREKNLLPLPEI